jgi:transmembrane sensor
VQASERTRLVFEEGSSVTLEAGSTWHPGRNDGRAFESELVTGTARFQVTPGGPRTWIVRAGPMTVEVVGTRFAVQRNADRRAVRVEEGTVVVRDPRIPGGTRTLQAGEEVVLASSPTAAREAPRAEVVRSSARPKRERPDPRSDRSGWREAARRGDHARAYTLLGPASWERAVGKADAAELMQLADVARLSGHAERALEPLERLVDRYPSDPRAALAAVLAGRILMDQLREPSRARPWLERALALGVGSALEPDVRDRLRSLGAPGSGSSP